MATPVSKMDFGEEQQATTSGTRPKTKTAEKPEKRESSTILVDPDDNTQQITQSKKPRLELDKSKKIKVLKFIGLSLFKIHQSLFKEIDPDMNNINIGMQVNSILFTAHNIIRQEVNGTGTNLKTKAGKTEYTITHMGDNYNMRRDDAEKLVKEAAKEVGLVYKKYENNDKENWYGTAGPYMDFFAAFGLRLTELRIGHSSMPISRNEGKSTSFPVSSYGLYGPHHVLLEGVQFPPEKRSSMAQSLGPMTAFLCMVRSPNNYAKKWEEAVKRAMSHIPEIDNIIAACRGKKATDIKPLITLLADILLITTSRQATRACFPPNIFARLTLDQTLFGVKYENMEYQDNIALGPILLEYFDTSGRGAAYLYKAACAFKWTMVGKFTQGQMAQVIYHCIWGTFKEDLTVLEHITDLKTWESRESIGNNFQEMNMSKQSSHINLIRNKYYSKLSSANQTGLLASAYIQTAAVPCFSGIRMQTFHDDFFEQIERRIGGISGGKTIQELITMLSNLLSELKKELITNGKKIKMGTVQWRTTDDLTYKEAGSVVKDLIIEGNCKFFLGSSKRF